MGRSTSGMGQTRTLDNVRVTSVKLLMADSKRTFSYVYSGPKADILHDLILRAYKNVKVKTGH
jgi:hypothetical protein